MGCSIRLRRSRRSRFAPLPSGLTYGEILERLGRTKDTGRDEHAYQYTVDGDKVLLLRFRMEEDICPHSGEELLAALEDAGQPSQSGRHLPGGSAGEV